MLLRLSSGSVAAVFTACVTWTTWLSARAPNRNASIHRTPHGCEISRHGLGPIALLLQGLSQFRDGGLGRLLLLGSFIDCLLRLRGLGLDLALCPLPVRSSSAALRALFLFECAALWLGTRRHRLRGLGFLRQGGGLLLLLLQGLSQFRDGALRRLLLFRGLIDCLLRLRGLGLDLARVPASSLARAAARACASSSARRCGSALAAIACAALASCIRAAVFFCSCCRDCRSSAMVALRRLLLLRGFIDCLL